MEIEVTNGIIKILRNEKELFLNFKFSNDKYFNLIDIIQIKDIERVDNSMIKYSKLPNVDIDNLIDLIPDPDKPFIYNGDDDNYNPDLF